MMDRVVPGGVAADLDEQAGDTMKWQTASLRQELDDLYNIINDLPSLEDRLDTTGYLSPESAKAFGALGYVGRASGVAFDVRKDVPYAPYTRFNIEVPVFKYGDVAARVKVRAGEILESFKLIEKLVEDLPPGPLRADWKPPATGAEGLGFTEGFRGEILAYVRFGENGRVARYFPAVSGSSAVPVASGEVPNNAAMRSSTEGVAAVFCSSI